MPILVVDKYLQLLGFRFVPRELPDFQAMCPEARRSLGYKIGEWAMKVKGLVRRTF